MKTPTFTIDTFTILILQNIIDIIDIVGNFDIVGNVDIVDLNY